MIIPPKVGPALPILMYARMFPPQPIVVVFETPDPLKEADRGGAYAQPGPLGGYVLAVTRPVWDILEEDNPQIEERVLLYRTTQQRYVIAFLKQSPMAAMYPAFEMPEAVSPPVDKLEVTPAKNLWPIHRPFWLPPRPSVFVFHNLSGYWCGLERSPLDGHLMIGFSLAMWWKVRVFLLEQCNANIEDRCHKFDVQAGSRVTINISNGGEEDPVYPVTIAPHRIAEPVK